MAKPVRGFASIGVHLLQYVGDVRTVTERGGYWLQEYLKREGARSYSASFKVRCRSSRMLRRFSIRA